MVRLQVLVKALHASAVVRLVSKAVTADGAVVCVAPLQYTVWLVRSAKWVIRYGTTSGLLKYQLMVDQSKAER